MMRNILVLYLSVLLVVALLLPVSGCIKLGKSPVHQPSANQTVPAAPSAPNPVAPAANLTGSLAPAAPNPPGAPGPSAPNPPANQSGMGVLEANPPANQSGVGVLEFNQPANQSGMGVLKLPPPGGQSGMGALESNPSNVPVPKKVANWSGKWLCGQWGTLNIAQSGDVITGTYTYDNGKLKGNVGGNMLFGTWSEAPSYSIPNDAGDVEFTMSDDGKSFTGRWRYGFTGEWRTWNGQRDLSAELAPE